MQAKERQKIILDQIYSNGMVKVTELSKELGVHEETIRRDLKALSSHWGIEIIYGGAVLKNLPPAPTVEEIILQTKRLENYEKNVSYKISNLKEKDRIKKESKIADNEFILSYDQALLDDSGNPINLDLDNLVLTIELEQVKE